MKILLGLDWRTSLVFTWALPRLEYEEVDMLLGSSWLCNKEMFWRKTDFQLQIQFLSCFLQALESCLNKRLGHMDALARESGCNEAGYKPSHLPLLTTN